MSIDDLKPKHLSEQTAQVAEGVAAEPPKMKGVPVKLFFVGAIVTAGAIFLGKKFNGKFPSLGSGPAI